jgi:monoamine oxidase
MSNQKFDTIIIGAGVAGMITAALLARDFGQRVLVLERAPFIGGRTLSFVGKGDKVVADGIEMDARQFRKSLPLASCYLGKCTPDIETIFAQRLLDGRTFEAGGHGLFWGNKSRVSHVMQHLGVFVNLPLNKGLGFIDWQGEGPNREGQPAIPYQVGKGKAYQWMSEEGYNRTMEQLRDMGRATFEDMAKLMRTPLQQWLEARGMHPEAYDYIKVLAASQTAQAEPAMTPAGDFLGYMAIAGQIGMNLVTGSVATCDSPGTIAIPQAMEQVCLEHGGTVLRNANVREVLIRDGRVTGVSYKHDEQVLTAEADNVVCTIPPKYIFKVLPEEHFPADWVRLLKEEFWGAGLLTGWAGARKSFFGDIGIDPRSFVYMPGVIRDEGYIGCVDMVMCEFTAWDNGAAKRGPEGKHDFLFSTALTDEEMRNPAKVNRVIDLCENWARATFPDWDENVEFIIWTPGPEAYGLWRPVGEDRPATRSPHVGGLYFAGDQYGERMWGGGVDGAALSGVLCVDQIMGSGLEESIFPPYHRGIPSIAA